MGITPANIRVYPKSNSITNPNDEERRMYLFMFSFLL